MSKEVGIWILVDPPEMLPCSLGIVVPIERQFDLRNIEQEGRERLFTVRAVLSDHVPLCGGMDSILTRPSYQLLSLTDKKLSIWLHHGGDNAIYFDLIRQRGILDGKQS